MHGPSAARPASFTPRLWSPEKIAVGFRPVKARFA